VLKHKYYTVSLYLSICLEKLHSKTFLKTIKLKPSNSNVNKWSVALGNDKQH